MIFIGHFCGVKDWDQPFSKWISEFRKELILTHPITLRNFSNSTIENIELAEFWRTQLTQLSKKNNSDNLRPVRHLTSDWNIASKKGTLIELWRADRSDLKANNWML